MRVYPLNWNVDQVVRREDVIDPKPAYQRGEVWSDAKKQLLIDTILRNYDIPKFYLRRLEGADYEHEVVDGQQRLKAIWDFVADRFPLGEKSNDLPIGDLSGKKYSELSTGIKDQIGLFQVSIFEIQDTTEIEIRDLFRRLQEGVSLTPAEKRHALMGNLRDFIADLAGGDPDTTPHPLFPLINYKSDGYKWEDLIAHVACLELASGPTNVKAADLYSMYERQIGFDINGSIANKIKRNFNYMARVFREETPEMSIKWGFVDLYLLISYLASKYDIRGREGDLRAFYVGFEHERRSVEEPAELIASGDLWDKDLYDYIDAFQREGAKRDNIEIRHKVYLKRMLKAFPDLVPLDETRGFSNEQRIVIWRRDGGICQICGANVQFDDFHADHIEPYAAGGPTVVENGRCTCQSCNQGRREE